MNEITLRRIAKEYGTPSFVFDTEALKKRMVAVKEIVGEKVHLCYSIKANPFLIPAMLECVEKLEVCSPGELCICERLQVPKERIIYSGVSKREVDVKEALEYGADVYTAESIGQVKRLNAEALKRKVVIPVILRLSAGSQFGMSKEDLCEVIENRKNYTGIEIEGIHYFAGTQRKKLTEQKKELEMLLDLFVELKEKFAYEVKKLEYGPGLPVPYFSNEDFSDTLAPLRELAPSLQEVAEKVALTIEMGRFFVTECGYYLTKVVDQKHTNGTNYAVIDGGMNHLNYLGQMMGMKVPQITHIKMTEQKDCDKINNTEQIDKIEQSNPTEHSNQMKSMAEKKDWCLCGSLCTTADIVVRQAAFEGLLEGDVLAFANVGAYSVTEGIYLFLSRTMPRILLAGKDGEVKMVRDFIESYELNCTKMDI